MESPAKARTAYRPGAQLRESDNPDQADLFDESADAEN